MALTPDGRAPGANHWHAIPGGQRDDLIGIRKKHMGSGRLSVISAYGYARHERTSAPAQANAPLVAERRVEFAQSTFATGDKTRHADLRLYDALRRLRTVRGYLPV